MTNIFQNKLGILPTLQDFYFLVFKSV